jgi:DNA-binding NarL/FixJ family response regulator
VTVPTALADALRDRYVLDRELGHGGMAAVYLAHDLRHDRPVALKVLHPDLAQTLGPERFKREIRLAARLQHPHILTVLDSGEADGRLWFTMPFVEGESLRDRLTRERQLPVDAALRIATEAARALEYAHKHGVVHRDIKPENILLTVDGSTLVADFGIARALTPDGERLTEAGLAIGTPAYMSPEQAAGDRALDARTDIYSLGAVLYEMLAGEPPFTGPSAQAIIAKRFSGEVPRVRHARSSVPAAVDEAVARALAPVAADRFESAEAFGRALGTDGATRVTVATPPVGAVRAAILASAPIRVLLADDHAIVRNGVAQILNEQADIRVVAEAEDGESAIVLYRQERPDVALLDLQMPKLEGFQVVERLRREFPEAVLVVLTTFDTDDDIDRALLAGAKGYLLKDVARGDLVACVRTVHAGGTWVSPTVASKLVARITRAQITPQEMRVLRQVAEGKSNREIGETLFISEATVKIHLSHLLEKLGASSRTDAVAKAVERGLIRMG